jgi:hypothetical protein
MKEQCTTYIIKSKLNGYIWRFKYHLNGAFISFEILEGQLNAKQVLWLFGGKNAKEEFQEAKFPIVEQTIKVWEQKLKDNFEITIELPDLTFEGLWNLYGNKAKKFESEKKFKKLTEAEKMKCFLSVPGYKNYVARKNISAALLATFIHQRYFEDDWNKV